MDKTLLKFKWEAAKRKVKETVKKGIEYAEEHKEILVPIGAFVLATGKTLLNKRKEHQDYVDRNTRFYDDRTRNWTYTKRVPNNRQMLEIERRYMAGETYRSILTDMGLL